ncbi:MAG: peptidylprolyl isomerase, partial [Bacteroidota bacterium]
MALINKIREKTGLAVGVIAFGLILFLVGGDILGPNSVLLGNNDTSVGTIAGEKVDFQDFSRRVEMVTQGRAVNSEQLPFVREQIWTDLVREISYGKKINTLGIGLPTNEAEEIVYGDNISPLIQQNFTNPQTGQFNKEDVVRFLQNYNTYPPQQKLAWDQLEDQVGTFRKIQKYQNLILKTNYVTKAEAKQDFMAKGATASVSFAYVPFLSVSDSVAKVTDSELSAYINAHKNEYQVDASRDIAYVEFKIAPSAADTADRRREIDELTDALRTSDKDSLFALRNSEALTPFRTVKKADMPQELRDIEDLPIGEVYGPYLKGDKFVVYKVAELSDKFSARASNIVISPEGDTDEAKAAARQKAAGILREIRNGADFAEKAAQYNKDRTAQTGGDLGWFTEGAMVPAFNDAVMGATKTGLIPRLIESSYGFHIIDVTATKIKDSYKLVQLEKEIYPS